MLKLLPKIRRNALILRIDLDNEIRHYFEDIQPKLRIRRKVHG